MIGGKAIFLMFPGFSDRMFEFFLALQFNNNREFFHENHAWYEEAVRNPLYRLIEEVRPVVLEIDPLLETRPVKALCRINRDTRYAHDKSPYRTYMWFTFRRRQGEQKMQPGLYFDISAQGASLGMGIYLENRPLMDALRRRILLEPQALDALTPPKGFSLELQSFKRMAVPEQVPEALKIWYPARTFYFFQDIQDFTLLKRSELAQTLAQGYRALKPAYLLFREMLDNACD